MDDQTKRINELVEQNKHLLKMVNTLSKRIVLVEKKLNSTANTTRNTEHTVRQLQTRSQLTETKVTEVQNILRRY